MKTRHAEIYALIDPRDMTIRYIGKAQNSTRRLKDHLREARRKTPLYAWIGKLRTIDMQPLLKVICIAISDDWQSLEKLLIEQYRGDGARLLNLAEGGDQPYCSDETRVKNGRALASRIASDPMTARLRANKQMLSAALRLGQLSERVKAKMRYCANRRPDLFGEWAAI